MCITPPRTCPLPLKPNWDNPGQVFICSAPLRERALQTEAQRRRIACTTSTGALTNGSLKPAFGSSKAIVCTPMLSPSYWHSCHTVTGRTLIIQKHEGAGVLLALAGLNQCCMLWAQAKKRHTICLDNHVLPFSLANVDLLPHHFLSPRNGGFFSPMPLTSGPGPSWWGMS